VLVDGNYAAIHVHAHRTGQLGAVLIDIFRLEGGLIVEQWDVVQFVPEHAANDHPLI
jgi:predicted SnoaL-like aldol condensation-catalyzing enzyme